MDAVPFAAGGFVLMRRRGKLAPGDRLAVLVVQALYFTVPTAVVGGTPGQSLLGLRVVDANSGAPVGWGRALQRWAIGSIPGVVVGTVSRKPGSAERRADLERRLSDIQPEVERLSEQYADDEEALDAHVQPLYRDAVGTSVGWMAIPVLFLLGALVVAAIGGWTKRSLRDRLTGTLIVARGR